MYRVSLRLDDSFMHMQDASYSSHTAVLPSSFLHQWGRALAMGSIAIRASTVLTRKSTENKHIFTAGMTQVWGDASSVMVEWSQPIARLLQEAVGQLENRYQLVSALRSATSKREKIDASACMEESGTRSTLTLFGEHVDFSVSLSGFNVFIYGATPGEDIHRFTNSLESTESSDVAPSSLLLRVDTLSVTNPDRNPLLFIQSVAVNDLIFPTVPREPFLCQSVANLPCGLLDVSSLQLRYLTTAKV